MQTLLSTITALGEVATGPTLVAHGVSRAEIDAALHDGSLRRVRRGWFATPRADADQVRAVALGGRLGCVSALRRWGLWSGEGDQLHVQVPGNASRLRPGTTKDSTWDHHPGQWHPAIPRRAVQGRTLRLAGTGRPVVHWTELPHPERRLDWIVSAQQALAQAARCQSDEHAIACLDSAIRQGVVRHDEALAIIAQLPVRLRSLAKELTPTAESGWESIAITRIRRGGFAVRSQVEIPGVGRLDGIIEECVGLEVNGLEFHTGPEAVHHDLSRILGTQRRGVPTVSVTPRHIVAEWPSTWAAIVRVVTEELRRRSA